MSVLRLRRREPPALPLEVFGAWGKWIDEAANAPHARRLRRAAVVVLLVGIDRALSLAAGVAGLGGTAASLDRRRRRQRRRQVPGGDCLHRNVLPAIKSRMVGDFPERLREWQAAIEADKAAYKAWQEAVRAAQKKNEKIPPPPHPTVSDVPPERPRLRQTDVTVEQLAMILATAAPKGVVVVRDELAGWLDGMNSYNPAGRAFWIEAYGGRHYSVERRKHGKEPIEIPRLAVAVCGGTQPDRLSQLIAAADDGLLSRIQWGWPEPVAFRIGEKPPHAAWAAAALDKLRELELAPGDIRPRYWCRWFPRGTASSRSSAAGCSSGARMPAASCARPTARRVAPRCACPWCWNGCAGAAGTTWRCRPPRSPRSRSLPR